MFATMRAEVVKSSAVLLSRYCTYSRIIKPHAKRPSRKFRLIWFLPTRKAQTKKPKELEISEAKHEHQ